MDKDQARDTALALLKSVGIPEAERRLDEYPHNCRAACGSAS